MKCNAMFKKFVNGLSLLTFLSTCFYTISAQAQSYIMPTVFRNGVVMSRSVVLDANKQPILVEYNDDGSEGNVVSIPGEYKMRVGTLIVMSSAQYLAEKERLKTFKEQHAADLAADAKLMSRGEFLSGDYPTADGKQVIAVPHLPQNVKSVLVRGQSNRIVNDSQQLVLLAFSVDLTSDFNPPENGTVLLSPEGQAFYGTKNTIAPRVGFFGDPQQKQGVGYDRFFRKPEDTIFGPVRNVFVYTDSVWNKYKSMTDETGKYALTARLLSCPGFMFTYNVPVMAEINYVNFSAFGNPTIPYYLFKESQSICDGRHEILRSIPDIGALMAWIDIEAAASSRIDMQTIDMRVDVMYLSGRAFIRNPDGSPITIGGHTEYKVDAASQDPAAQRYYDFDGDGRSDTAVLGDVINQMQPDGTVKKVFQPNPQGALQGVYFSSGGTGNGQPDVIRQADTVKKPGSNGLLNSISLEDFKNTDVMIFRESTGQLVLDRRGLPESEQEEYLNNVSIGLGKKDQSFFYRLMLRGASDTSLNTGGGIGYSLRKGSWEDFATAYRLAEPFQKRQGDNLKSGEWVRVVIINRPTGYMATQRVQLNDVGQNDTGLLSMPVDPMVLLPPNLKIWAERDYTQDNGLNKGTSDKNNIIGAEGAALNSDDRITVYTEWFDHDGTPLPEGLGADRGEQHGYTGRLAKVTGSNQLSAVSEGKLAEFPIAPGRNTQVLRVKDNLTAAEHFYIHVSGTTKDKNPDFSTANNSEGLEGRPQKLTPFLAPTYDENMDWYSLSAWNIAKQAFDENASTIKPLRPLPSYAWSYRPEYQFSQYGLEVTDLKRTLSDGSSKNLLTDSDSLISTQDQLLDIFYSLVSNNNDRLSAIDGPQDLVFAVGAEEVKATLGVNGQVQFSNLAQLAALKPEDLLTVRLYSNQDAGNVLWQFAFETYESRELSRNSSMAQFNDQPAYALDKFDSFTIVNIPLETQSAVQVNLLDNNKKPVSTLVGTKVLPFGMQSVVVLRKDLESLVPRSGVDGYLLVKTIPTNGNPAREKLYEININDRVSGEMLGQVVEFDTLLQRGSLTLRREDLVVPGAGPKLDFSRSYANEAKPETKDSPMGAGWSHNHNIFIQVLAEGDGLPPYDNNLPNWIGATRESGGEPRYLDRATLQNLMNRPVIPSMVAVSNGGNFKRNGGSWIPQRGNHGSLVELETGGWEYKAKDGTTYTFGVPDIKKKAFVKTIADRNGNKLTYSYITYKEDKLVSSIVDDASRSLNFSYSLTDDGKMLLDKVSTSTGVDLEFTYFKQEGTAYDPRVGMLDTFKRGDFTEKYGYLKSNTDPTANLQTVTDANGQVTRYEYYAEADVPHQLDDMAAGINRHDIVHKVFYPSTSAPAELKYPVTATENIREVTDLNGNKKTYTLNRVGNPVRLDEPESKSTTFQWSADMGEPDNLLRHKVDLATNSAWEYQYDARGNITQEKDPYGKITEQTWNQKFSVLLYRKDKNGDTINQILDEKGNVKQESRTATIKGSKSSVTVKHNYGESGSFKGLLLSTIDGRNGTTSFEYDAAGIINKVLEPEGSTTSYTNNARGMRIAETDAAGKTKTFEYDDLDRLTKITDPENNTVAYTYDKKGNKKSEETIDNYSAGTASHTRYLKLTYTYDGRDRVSSVARVSNLDGQYSLAGNKTYSYDGNSNLLTESDWKGVSTTHTYDALNRRTSTKNRADHGMSTTYAFTGNGLTTSSTDYEGRVTQQYSDKLGRVTKLVLPPVSNSDGTGGNYTREMTYDNLSNVTKLVDENGHTTLYEYDARNLKIAQTNADNKKYIWQYDESGNLVQTKDEAERITTYSYDKQNRLTEKRAPANQKWTYTYYPTGTVKTETDPWSFTYSYTYNGINQRTSVTHPDGIDTESYTNDGKLVYKKDPENRSVTSLYGPEDRLQQTIDARGRTTTNTYDLNNNLTESVVAWSEGVSGPTEVATHNEYDNLDRLKKATTAHSSNVAQLTEFNYDKLGNTTRISKPDGRVTEMQYDELNRAKLIRTAAVDGLNQDSKQVWDGLGNKVSVTDRRGKTTFTEYDNLNRPKKVTYADGNFVSYSYDPVGNLLSETDRRGNITEHTYDGLNREVERFVSGSSPRFRLLKNEYDIGGSRKNAVTDANGNRVEMTQDWRGNTLETTLPAGAGYGSSQIVNVYDKSGFLTRTTDAAGFATNNTYYADGTVATTTNAENKTTAFAYDIFANKARITKPSSAAQNLIYDQQNRLVQVSDALGGVTEFDYDSNNNLIRQQTPAANDSDTVVTYTYDSLNRKRSHKQPGNLVTSYVYDAEGNLTQTTDAKNQVFSVTYDDLNRIASQQFPAGSDVTNIVNTYDANGNLDTVTETKSAGGTELTSHSYDLLNRLTSQTQRGHAISYAYDNNGNRTQVTSIGGSTSYTYDSRNRLKTVVAGTTATYAYLANGWLQQVTHGNGTSAAYTYDNTGRVASITNKLANQNVLSSFAYSYDDNGNRSQQVETQHGFLTAQTVTTDYRYDLLDRLEGFTETSGATVTDHSFTYFPSYDRKTEKVVRAGVTLKDRTYTYNGKYWLTGISEALGGSITYQYDNNGNTIRKTDTTAEANAASTVFNYNTRNQLQSVAQGAVNSEIGQGTYAYNYAGMRTRHLGSERGDVEYLYDQDSIIDEVQNNSTSLIAHYRYGDRLLSLSSGGSDQFYHYAGLGTTANLTNAAGESQIAYRTDPFGEITQQQGTSANRHVFTGQEHDEKTGLIYFGARFYDPDTARFINQDTYLGEGDSPPSLHRYLYAYSNPTIYVDSNGNFPITEQVAAWLSQRATDNTNALKSIQRDHGSTMTTRSVAALSGVGSAIFSAAGGVVSLVDMSLDGSAASLRKIPGAEKISVIKDAAKKTDQRIAAISDAVIGAKDYVSQENLAKALQRDAGKAANAASTYAGDVFVRGNLDATASFSGAMAEIAGGGVVARASKLSKITPKVSVETPNIHNGPSNALNPKNSVIPDGCACCFAGGTPVLTKDGLKPIESVKEGELVASRNDKTGEIEWKPVTALFVNDDDRLTYALILVDAQGHEEKYEVTDNHPFNVEGLGWIDSSKLEVGMKIPSYKGGYLTVVSFTALNRSPKTYNFEVKDFHTYFVGEQGAWVHNICSCEISGQSPKNEVKRMEVGDSGHHVPAVRKSKNRPFEVDRSDKDRPTLHFKSDDPAHDHWRLHDAERQHVGPRQGDFKGTDQELFDAYKKAYEGLDDIKVDVKSPNGKHILGEDITPREAVECIECYLKAEGKL